MVSAYSKEGIDDLRRNLGELRSKTDQVLILCSSIDFSDINAKAFAFEGLSRRLQMLTEAILELFSVIPPEIEKKPTRQRLFLASALLHSIYINSFGAIDNLSHIWEKEFCVRKCNGKRLPLKEISIFHKDRFLLESIGGKYVELIDSRRDWFKYLTQYRDELAHQIPPYIPSTLVDPDCETAYLRLELERLSRVSDENLFEIDKEISKITHFKPFLFSKSGARSPTLFHAQVICDYLTVEELSMELLRAINEKNRQR